MITRANYEEKVEGFGVENLDEILKSTHKWYVENQEFYSEDKEVKETIDLYFRKLERYINQHTSENKVIPPQQETKRATPAPSQQDNTSTSVPKVDRKEQAKQSQRKKASRPVQRAPVKRHGQKQTTTKQDPNKKIDLVENIREEVKIIRRYVALHEKKKDASTILSLIKALQKAIVEKRIGKKSQLAGEIRLIQKNLLKVYEGMGKEIFISINEKDLSRMAGIVGGEKVYPSISFLKRYIAMQGKPLDKAKADAYTQAAEKALQQKIGKEDPYLNKVKAIVKAIKTYQKSNEEYLTIPQAELNGLEGIVKGCSCSALGKLYKTEGKLLRRCKKKTYSDSKKGACSHNKGLEGVMTASQVAAQHFEFLPFTGHWLELVGKPEKNFQMMLHGEPGAGKSTFIIKFAGYLTRFGKVLYVSSEEFGSATLASKVKELLHPIPNELHFASDLFSINLSNYQTVVLDSINDLGLTLDDFKKLKSENPTVAFILVLQQTKQGQFKGGKEWEHEMQIAGNVKDGVINIYKNRYGVKGSMNFFEVV